MPEIIEYSDTYWSAEDRKLLDGALGLLVKDPRVTQPGPIREATIGGRTLFFVALRTTQPLGPPTITGITEEGPDVGAILAGSFMAGPPSRSVSIRALLLAMTAGGFITREEALAAAQTGAIPASLREPLFASVDEDTRFAIELAWAAMYEADRASLFWQFVTAAGIATAEQIDAVFNAATSV
jgi:hypothetical protein